jgi:hypothetical protein
MGEPFELGAVHEIFTLSPDIEVVGATGALGI